MFFLRNHSKSIVQSVTLVQQDRLSTSALFCCSEGHTIQAAGVKDLVWKAVALAIVCQDPISAVIMSIIHCYLSLINSIDLLNNVPYVHLFGKNVW